MQNVFNEVNSLDKRCYEELGLTEDILIENAAAGMLNFINDKFSSSKTVKILIVAGTGNNGADGIALARMLHSKYEVKLYLPFQVKSTQSIVQLTRAEIIGVNIVHQIEDCNVVVDCLFGTGLNRDINESSISIIQMLNNTDAYKIACDIPSGINNKGQINQISFKADTTLTMGALKKSLFSDEVKDYVGNIKVLNLGIQRDIYELESNCFLLDESDMKLPYRKLQSTHKGNFGHLSVVVGDKRGAGLLSCEVALNFGVGLVTAITSNENIPYSIMNSEILPQNTTAIAIGMGLGDLNNEILENNIPKVIDADMFYKDSILNLLDKTNIVLTPHPKEFINLLKLTSLANITIEELQKNRFKYVELFCKQYPKTVLVLKGSNTLICQNDKMYINTLGTSALSFGGSGDILSGLIGSLLAQGYSSLDSAITGSLAHTVAASKYNKADFSLTPTDLIEQIKQL